jgi:hypothetical protein
MGYDRRVTGWLAAAGAVVLIIGLAQAAAAVSGGGYNPAQQDCPPNGSASNAGAQGAQQTQNPVPGCHNAKVNVADGAGNRYAEVGVDQLPSGYPSTPGLTGVGYPQTPNFPHSGCAAVNTAGTGGGCGNNSAGVGASATFDTESLFTCVYQNVWLPDPTGSGFDPTNPTKGMPTSPPSAACTPGSTPDQAVTFKPDTGTSIAPLLSVLVGPNSGITFYLGADDNLDAGEHDGVTGTDGTKKATNGPSDGGAITAHVTPGDAQTMPSATNPVPVAGASEGQCADGFCGEITTQQQTLYSGGTTGSRDVTDYQGKDWDPYNCSSGDTTSQAPASCGGQSLDSWRQQEAKSVQAEPGVQVYEDPDPQASPIDPVYEAGLTPAPVLYPLPGVYAGTCGVIVGGGPVATAPASPVTNHAGQVDILPTGC